MGDILFGSPGYWTRQVHGPLSIGGDHLGKTYGWLGRKSWGLKYAFDTIASLRHDPQPGPSLRAAATFAFPPLDHIR